MTLDLTAAALSDLRSIRAYTLETWGEEQEEKYLNEMWDKFEEIMRNPGHGRLRNDLFLGLPFGFPWQARDPISVRGKDFGNRACSARLHGLSPAWSGRSLSP